VDDVLAAPPVEDITDDEAVARVGEKEVVVTDGDGVLVAPGGVNRLLVMTSVDKGTADPTSTEYGGRKSKMCCVFWPVVQLQAGPSAQQ